MGHIITLCKRQLRAYLHAPATYAVMAAFLAAAGWSFCRPLAESPGHQVRVGDLLYAVPAFWAAVLALAALLAMPLLAEERRRGTLEALLTAPVTDLQVVLGKYAGALCLFLLLTAPTPAYFALLRTFAPGVPPIDPAPVAVGLLGVWLIGACFLAVGLLVSALTDRQATAAAVTLLIGAAWLYVPDGLRTVLPPGAGARLLEGLSAAQHVRDFSQGILDTRPLVLYLAGTVWSLFATVKVLEARQWT